MSVLILVLVLGVIVFYQAIDLFTELVESGMSEAAALGIILGLIFFLVIAGISYFT